MSTARRLVVTGATGKQGGALISALLSKPSQPFEIYAVTRSKASGSAQKLEKQGVRIIEGNFSDAEAIFKQVEHPWGLFSVTLPMGGAAKEEKEGKAMTAAAIKAGVQHIVFTATERGGQEKSEGNSTQIPHFVSKFNIEKDIISKSRDSKQGTTWTFLRPVAFFENLSNSFFGRGFVAMWRLNGLDRPLQQISTKDIGKIAAEAFLNADSAEYKNQAISLAGDELTPNEAAKIFKEETGLDLPSSYWWVGWLLRKLVSDLGKMFDWFYTDGFKADVPAIRKRYPFMQDFRTWLREESDWSKNKAKRA